MLQSVQRGCGTEANVEAYATGMMLGLPAVPGTCWAVFQCWCRLEESGLRVDVALGLLTAAFAQVAWCCSSTCSAALAHVDPCLVCRAACSIKSRNDTPASWRVSVDPTYHMCSPSTARLSEADQQNCLMCRKSCWLDAVDADNAVAAFTLETCAPHGHHMKNPHGARQPLSGAGMSLRPPPHSGDAAYANQSA